jgi:hypothetical protein
VYYGIVKETFRTARLQLAFLLTSFCGQALLEVTEQQEYQFFHSALLALANRLLD